jgi:hypothetical protein
MYTSTQKASFHGAEGESHPSEQQQHHHQGQGTPAKKILPVKREYNILTGTWSVWSCL